MEIRKSKQTSVSIGMGGSLIITIFVVLCLTVFSVLSFTTAYSDLKLAKKTETMAFDYYSAHGKAEEKLAEIYEVLNFAENFNINSAAEVLSQINGLNILEVNNQSIKVYYESLGSENQKICVTLNINYDKSMGMPYYDIETWNLTAIVLPDYEEENLELWEGFE